MTTFSSGTTLLVATLKLMNPKIAGLRFVSQTIPEFGAEIALTEPEDPTKSPEDSSRVHL